jgi:hypothetical protein
VPRRNRGSSADSGVGEGLVVHDEKFVPALFAPALDNLGAAAQVQADLQRKVTGF